MATRPLDLNAIVVISRVKTFCFLAIVVGVFAPAHLPAQGTFQNLDFEQATIAPTAPGQFGSLVADPAAAFPGWTVGPGGTSNPNYTLYNNLTLGSVAEVLVGRDFPNGIGLTALQGSFSALLQFGPSVTLGTPSLSQTGLIPADARSINFLVGARHNDARVTIGGVEIPLVAIDGGRMAGDASAFAGLVEPLKFSTTSYNGNWLYFDDVTFSTQIVPEPGPLGLLVVSGIFLGWCWWRGVVVQ